MQIHCQGSNSPGWGGGEVKTRLRLTELYDRLADQTNVSVQNTRHKSVESCCSIMLALSCLALVLLAGHFGPWEANVETVYGSHAGKLHIALSLYVGR